MKRYEVSMPVFKYLAQVIGVMTAVYPAVIFGSPVYAWVMLIVLAFSFCGILFCERKLSIHTISQRSAFWRLVQKKVPLLRVLDLLTVVVVLIQLFKLLFR